MIFLFFLVISISLFFLGQISLKNTVFEVSITRNNFSGLLLYKEIFLFILPGVFLLNYFGSDKFSSTKNVIISSIIPISVEIVLTIIIFFVTYLFFSKIFFGKNILKNYTYQRNESNKSNKNYRYFLYYISFIGLFLIFLFQVKYGAKHAFLYSIFGGDSLLSIRLKNAYNNNIPSVLNSYLNFIYFFLAALLGSKTFDNFRFKRYIFIFFAVFFATFGGEKSPFFNVIFVFLLSFYSFHKFRINVLSLIRIFVTVLILIVFLFYFVKLQYSNFNIMDFLLFLFERVGVGQISGVYEEFNLKITNAEYIWHAIPFANQFIDYPIFQKDLMLISENVLDPNSTGVKSSLFISEAYAMGGWKLACASPFIVGFSFVFSYKILCKCLNKTICDKYTASKVMPLVFLSFMHLTGDFSAWFMFKGCLLLLIFLLITWLPFWFLVKLLKPLRVRLIIDGNDV